MLLVTFTEINALIGMRLVIIKHGKLLEELHKQFKQFKIWLKGIHYKCTKAHSHACLDKYTNRFNRRNAGKWIFDDVNQNLIKVLIRILYKKLVLILPNTQNIKKMKPYILSIVFNFLVLNSKAQTADTATTIIKTTNSAAAKSEATNINVNVGDTANYTRGSVAKTGDVKDKEVSVMEWLLVFSPMLIFLIISLSIRNKLKGFGLKEALQDGDQAKKTIINPEYTTANLQALATNPAMTSLLTPTIEISDGVYPKSSSRYIALITSTLTWTISLCLTSYFIYAYIKTGKAPELNKLTDIVLTLGIGVVPYVFNKVSESIKK